MQQKISAINKILQPSLILILILKGSAEMDSIPVQGTPALARTGLSVALRLCARLP